MYILKKYDHFFHFTTYFVHRNIFWHTCTKNWNCRKCFWKTWNIFWSCEQIMKSRTNFKPRFFLNIWTNIKKWNILWNYIQKETAIFFEFVNKNMKTELHEIPNRIWNDRHFLKFLNILSNTLFLISDQILQPQTIFAI